MNIVTHLLNFIFQAAFQLFPNRKLFDNSLGVSGLSDKDKWYFVAVRMSSPSCHVQQQTLLWMQVGEGVREERRGDGGGRERRIEEEREGVRKREEK